MPMSAVAITVVKMNRPLNTCIGINAARTYTGLTGRRKMQTPSTIWPIKQKSSRIKYTHTCLCLTANLT